MIQSCGNSRMSVSTSFQVTICQDLTCIAPEPDGAIEIAGPVQNFPCTMVRWDLPIPGDNPTPSDCVQAVVFFKSKCWLNPQSPVGPENPQYTWKFCILRPWDPSFLWSLPLSCPPLVSEADTECRPFTWTGGLSPDSLLARHISTLWVPGTLALKLMGSPRLKPRGFWPSESWESWWYQSSSSAFFHDNFGTTHFFSSHRRYSAVLGVVTGTEAEWSPSPAGFQPWIIPIYA